MMARKPSHKLNPIVEHLIKPEDATSFFVAKKIAKYLESIGWDVDFNTRICKKCEKLNYNAPDNYCSSCGTKLPKPMARKEGINNIRDALKFAFSVFAT